MQKLITIDDSIEPHTIKYIPSPMNIVIIIIIFFSFDYFFSMTFVTSALEASVGIALLESEQVPVGAL